MNIRNIIKLSSILVASLFGLIIIFSSYYTVQQGNMGAVLRFGKIVEIASPGFGFKFPFIETVVLVPTTEQKTFWDVKDANTTSEWFEKLEMESYSQDQQPANLRVSILWHIPASDVRDFYSKYQTLDVLQDNLIARIAPKDVKTVFGQYTAPEVIQKRAKFNADVSKAVEDDIVGPVSIDSVQVENIDFSNAYEQAVEERMTAQVQVQQKQQQELQEEINAKIAVIQAQGRADSVLAEAKADAQAKILSGNAEAEAIKARGDALKDNPELPSLVAAEKWNGQLPSTMVPGTTVPFLNLTNK